MATTGELLVELSGLPTGTALVHLLEIETGGEGTGETIYIDSIRAEISDDLAAGIADDLAATIDDELAADIADDLAADIDDDTEGDIS